MARSNTVRPKRQHANALLQGVTEFLHASSIGEELNISDLPKRFTIYEPMLLLPPTFTSHSPAWKSVYDGLSQAQQTELFCSIATAFCRTGHKVTHVAMNAPIAPIVSDSNAEQIKDNVMRSPVHLQDLYGNFGPIDLLSPHPSAPTREDFDAAFWVETSQLTGIKQVWAPRWSMFSRGNIGEKARILGFAQQNPSPFPGLNEQELGELIARIDVVDMYVGIGYFALSYLKKGVRRVFGWDINPWSIEALRRGCVKNGFDCEVVKLPDPLNTAHVENIADHINQLLARRDHLRCIAFLGDNRAAGDIVAAVARRQKSGVSELNVRHCNLGLLPTSEGSWEGAVKAIDGLRGGWVHVHENAELKQVEQKRASVESGLQLIIHRIKNKDWLANCEHTEMVKTYAPGVGHFVFDIWIGPSKSIAVS